MDISPRWGKRPWQRYTTRRLAAVLALAACTLGLPAAAGVAATTHASKTIVAPAKIGAFAPRSANKLMNKDAVGKKQIARLAVWNRHTSHDVSAAYGGAPAVVESYANANLTILFSLVAVRASTPGLFTTYSDPKVLQLARPYREVETFDGVQCLVQNDATPSGQTPPATSVHTLQCERSGPHLTVIVMDFGDSLGNHPAAAAAIVSEAWQKISAA